MEPSAIFSRLVKPVLVALLMFGSLRALGVTADLALAGAAVPLLLGLLNIMTSFSYLLTAVVFLAAIGFYFAADYGLDPGGLVARLRGMMRGTPTP